MARPLLRVLCLCLIVLLTATVATAGPKAKPKAKAAKGGQDSTAASATTSAPAVPPPGQDTGVRRTFSFAAATEPLNPQPSLFGYPGLWKTIGANGLPRGSFGGTAWVDRINRNPGFLTITTTGWSAFVSLSSRFALMGQVNVNRRILVRRHDQLSFGQEYLAAFGLSGCGDDGPVRLPNNCVPRHLVPVVRASPQRIPLLRDVYTGVLSGEAGFYDLYPWANARTQNGFAEVEVAGHINLWNTGEGSGVGWALRPFVKIPTRFPNAADNAAPGFNGVAMFTGGRMLNNAVQTGSWQFGMELLVEGHIRDAMGLYFNSGFHYVRDPKENGVTLIGLRNNIPVRIGINIPRTSRLQLLLEYTADHFVGGGTRNRFAEDSTDWAADATAGFRAYFTPWLSLSGGYRHTVNQWGGDKHGFVAQLAASHVPVKAVEVVAPPTVTCTADVTTINAGQTVTVTATASSTAGGTLTYAWSATGGTIEGTGPTARWNTTGLAPGTYSATVRVTDSRGGFADCTVQITVRAVAPPPAPRAPTVTCTADQTSVAPGQVVTLRATGTSSDNRPLNYDWTVTGGRIEGTGATVRWDTTGLTSGTYTATVRVTDDRGMSADCSVSITVAAPEVRKPQRLNECMFRANSARVDNVCKAVLDDVALRLQSEADSRAIVVGNKEARERAATLAAQRASNVKHYLTREKGIDPGRIDVRTGTEDSRRVEIWLVPRGANATEVPGTAATETAAPAPARKVRRPARKAATTGEAAAPAAAPAEKAPAAKKAQGAGTPR